MQMSIPSLNKYEICDSIELSTFTNGECQIEDYYYSSEEDEENIDTNQISDIIELLNRRLELYYPYIPFSIHGKKVKSNFNSKEDKRKNLHYFFCVYYSLNGASGISREDSTLFEKIVDSALKKYLDTDESILTSFGDTDLSIKEKIHKLLEVTNELIGSLDLMPPHAKDGGIDIITYKPLDKRGNQIILLTDATLGKNWSSKNVISKLNHWIQYISFKTDPLTCLALSKIVPTEKFHSASRDNGILFDRPRILKYYSSDPVLEKKLINWENTIECNL